MKISKEQITKDKSQTHKTFMRLYEKGRTNLRAIKGKVK